MLRNKLPQCSVSTTNPISVCSSLKVTCCALGQYRTICFSFRYCLRAGTTYLGAGRSMVQTPACSRNFLFSRSYQTSPEVQQASCTMGTVFLSGGGSGRGVELITHPHPTRELKTNGTVFLSPLRVSVACYGMTFTFTVSELSSAPFNLQELKLEAINLNL